MQLQEYLQDLNARMSASKTTGMWSDNDKKRWINRAIIRACNFARWNFLNHHSSQLTEAGVEAYFTPFDYKPGGMMFLKVDGKEHAKTSVENLQRGDHMGERVFCMLGDQYLLKPKPDKDALVIDLFYRRRPIPLVNDTDEPITPEEMDEPIVKLALAVCLKKLPSRSTDADREIAEAIALLQTLKDREDEEPGEAGFVGKATSTRSINRSHEYGT